MIKKATILSLALFLSSNSLLAQTKISTGMEPFKDESGETVRQLAKYENISFEEASRKLKLMANASILANKLEKAFPNNFTGMTVIHKPFLSFDFKMTGMPIGEIDRNVRSL